MWIKTILHPSTPIEQLWFSFVDNWIGVLVNKLSWYLVLNKSGYFIDWSFSVCRNYFTQSISIKSQQERKPALCGLKHKRFKIQWTIQDVFTATVAVTVCCTNNAGNANGRNHMERCGLRSNSISVQEFGILAGRLASNNGNQLRKYRLYTAIRDALR